MGARPSTGRKTQELFKVLQRQFGKIVDDPNQKLPCARLVDEIYTVVELSEHEILIAANGNIELVTRDQWLPLFELLKRSKIAPMSVLECEEPYKFVVYDSKYRVHHINTKSGVVRRVPDDRGTLVRNYLLRVIDDKVIFRNTENDLITEMLPFPTNPLLVTSWFTGLTDDRTGIRMLARNGVQMILQWQYQGQTVPLHKLPELAEQPGLVATVSTMPRVNSPHDGRVEAIRTALDAGNNLQVNRLADGDTIVCTMPLNSAGKKIIVMLRSNEALFMLCRPQTEYSEFTLFQN